MNVTMPTAPVTLDQLLARCQQIAGLTLGQLAAELQVSVPADLRRDKGWVGQLLELALGASGGSQAIHDFPHLELELKTLPIDRHGKPLESTYVCVAPLTGATGQQWPESWVCRKLSRVLWLPILAERDMAPAQRIIGQGFIWQPDAAQQALLQQDWEELMELIALGRLDQIKGAHGKVLQLRPKAADSKALTAAIGADGRPVLSLPRGFYLKVAFTRSILAQAFGLESER